MQLYADTGRRELEVAFLWPVRQRAQDLVEVLLRVERVGRAMIEKIAAALSAWVSLP